MVDKDFVAEFESFNEVLHGCASHLSEEGIFFEAARSGAVGSEVGFEVRIRDGFSVLRGEGEIVQATDEGVFLRLVYLDQPSLKLLPKLLEHYRRSGVPLLELPAGDPAPEEDVAEVSAAEELDIIEEPVAEPTAKAEMAPLGLTLNDLEAEFSAEKSAADDDDGSEANSGSALVDVTEASELNATQDEESLELAVEEEEPPEPVLIDPDELIADVTENREDFAPNDIHLDELLPGEEAADLADDQAMEPADSKESSGVDEVPVDSGLPWLPSEPAKKSRKDLWVILLLIVLGAALGVAFYYFFLRSTSISQWRPADPSQIQARVVPAASQVAEPIPFTVGSAELAPQPEIQPVRQNGSFAASAPATPSPQSHDPPSDLLTGVDRITWAKEAGETVITFWGDGLFVAEQVDDFRVAGGAPREVVRIRGVLRPFPQQRVELDSDHVRQIRIGLHQEADGAALHFVADLVDSEVEILRTEAAGQQLRVYFSKAS